MFAKPKVDTDEVVIKSLPTESDLFDDVSEGGDLFDDKTPIKEEESKEEDIFGIDEDEPKDDKDDLAGIDDKDLFTGSAQQCDYLMMTMKMIQSKVIFKVQWLFQSV